MSYNGYGEAISATEGLVGIMSASDTSQGFKADVAQIYTAYNTQGVNVIGALGDIAFDRNKRDRFVDMCCESLTETKEFQDSAVSKDPYFTTYVERFHQYLDNSMVQMANESVMTGYSPIQSYAPFMLKRQWVSCVWKDVLQADIAKSNIIKIPIEERYLIDGKNQMYRTPDVYYNKELMKKLYDDATGINLKEDPIALPMERICLIDPSKNADTTKEYYVEPLVIRDARETMTHDYTIFQVIFKDSDGNEHTVPCDIKPDLASKTLIGGGDIRCTVFDENGAIKEILRDDITGYVDFDTGTVSVYATGKNIVKICHRGKAVNRFNHRTLGVKRLVTNRTFYMGESGPRLNAAITVEEAQDAICTANIDLYADNVDMMGDCLANLQDFQIKSFAMNSFERFDRMTSGPLGYDEKFTATSGFDVNPNTLGVGITIDVWMNQSKEYFERFLDDLVYKIKAENMTIAAVCHPKLIRYLRADLKWIFSDQTDVSGIKLSHKIGVSTTDGKRIHFVTSMYMDPNDGVYVLLLPNTTDVVTMKHIMHSAIIDRGYQNPLEPLVPNVMCTQRSLTFEISPVQGFFKIYGRQLTPPTTHSGKFIVESTSPATAPSGPSTPVVGGGDEGDGT